MGSSDRWRSGEGFRGGAGNENGGRSRRSCSGWFYILSLRTFLALTFSEADLLSFLKGPEPVTYDIAEMNKKIRTSLTSNKSITFAFVEPLDGSGEFI